MIRQVHQFRAMGSPCELVFYADNHQQAKEVIRQISGEVTRLEQKYSRYRDDNVVYQINQTASRGTQSKRSICLDQETSELLDYAAVAYAQSGGLFDISSGVYRLVWDFKSGKLPSQNHVDQIKAIVGWDKLVWESPCLNFLVKNMQIDFGGYVKEYAVDKSTQLMKQLGIQYGYVDLGGDIGIVGPQADHTPWNIGIRNPRQPQSAIATIEMRHGAIASSGDYERYMVVDGKRYCHIINPKTGWPVSYWSCVSVAADHCLIAGTASTITMLMEENGEEWINELGLRSVRQNRAGEVFASPGEVVV